MFPSYKLHLIILLKCFCLSHLQLYIYIIFCYTILLDTVILPMELVV